MDINREREQLEQISKHQLTDELLKDGFKVTRGWIMQNRTKKGSWTKAQIECLGMTWDERTVGWIDRIEGQYISRHQKSQFERCKTVKSQNVKKTREKKTLTALIGELDSVQAHLKQLQVNDCFMDAIRGLAKVKKSIRSNVQYVGIKK